MRAFTTRSIFRSLVVLAAAGAAMAVPRAEPVFEQIVFPLANVTMTSPTGINASGDIVGQYVVGGVRHGFLLDALGNFTSIDVPGATGTFAWGINAAGDIVGDYTLPGSTLARGFVLREGEWLTIDCAADLQAVQTFAFGITASGDVVGEFKRAGVGSGAGRAFRYADGVCEDITPPAAGTGNNVAVAWTTNDAGDAGGYYVSGGVTRGWMSDRHGNYTTLDYPNSVFTNVRGISTSGDMVGLYRLAAAPTAAGNRGFLLSAGGDWSPLDYPGSTRTRALGINTRGDIVGDYGGGDCAVNACGWVLRR